MSRTDEVQATASEATPMRRKLSTSKKAIKSRARKRATLFMAVSASVCGIAGAIFLPEALQQLSALPWFRVPGSDGASIEYTKYWFARPAMALLGLIAGAGVGRFLQQVFAKLFGSWDRMHIGDKVDLFLGIFLGIVASLPLLFVFQGLGNTLGPLLTFTLTVGFSAVSVYVLKSISEILPWHKTAGLAHSTGIKVLDTNVLIDGRLFDIIRTGFLEGELYVPKFVLLELQHIADSADSQRRQRGRRGLDVLRLMQADFHVEVGIYDKFAPDEKEEVDSRLVRLAKAVGGELVSNDFNLNRVAKIQDVPVLNVNDLALALRSAVMPGEGLTVRLIREGSQQGQAVGYLDDGTMIVVEDGLSSLGKVVNSIVSQVIQTERGKMIFASIEGRSDEGSRTGR
jgi:uncharacterized protein YacL